MSSQFRPWIVMVNSFVTALVFMLAFTLALPWCLVATTHRSVVRAEGRFYCFCVASRYIRTKFHPITGARVPETDITTHLVELYSRGATPRLMTGIATR